MSNLLRVKYGSPVKFNLLFLQSKSLANPFKEGNTDLISLISKDIADLGMKASLNKIKGLGNDQFEAFIKERLVEISKPKDDSISRNVLTPQIPTGLLTEKGRKKPQWTTLPALAVSCKELVYCGCKRNCGKRCKCIFRASLFVCVILAVRS